MMLTSEDRDKANAEAQKVWEWVLLNIDDVKGFAADIIWNKYKSVDCSAKSSFELMKMLPMPGSIAIGFHDIFEIIFDDLILDKIFGGSCYEIVVRVGADNIMQEAFLFKYS